MIETGKVLQQRYRIQKQIGQGGMGAVYVATDERFGSVVAIKETLLMNDSYRKAIEREARLLNSLKHVALPRVSDHFLEENGQFLVMEYIPGEDLGHMIERDEQPFAVDRVLKWADQLLDALDFLHNQSMPVIHRDIKPQNLKLTPRDQIILLDFGLAKGNPTDAGHQTAAKSIFGYSRNYASLEQIQGTGTDPRSDFYSLAATLYHLMTGVPPEDALTRAMAVLSGGSDPLTPANQMRKEITAGVAGVLQRAMDLNAASRPASATEMRTMLREHEKYDGFAVSSPGFAPRTHSDITTEPTKLMPTDTLHEGGKLTDVKTELHPGYDSEETKVRATAPARFVDTGSDSNAPVRVAARPRRSGIFAGFAVVALICAGAFGAYVFKAGSAGAEEPAVVPVSIPAEPAANSSKSPRTVDTGQVDEGGSAERTKSTNSDRITDTAKGTKAPDKPDANADPDDIDIDGPTVYVGNIKVRNGSVVTPDTIIDANGVRRRVSPKPMPVIPGLPPLTPDQMKNLTPAERRKLRTIYLRQQRRPPDPAHPIP